MTKSGRKSHMDREHKGKKFKCKFCTKRLASQFSVIRHTLSAHPHDEIEADEQTKYEVLYDRVEDIVPPSQEDAVIARQSEKIKELENTLRESQQEVKKLRQKVKSIQSSKLQK